MVADPPLAMAAGPALLRLALLTALWRSRPDQARLTDERGTRAPEHVCARLAVTVLISQSATILAHPMVEPGTRAYRGEFA